MKRHDAERHFELLDEAFARMEAVAGQRGRGWYNGGGLPAGATAVVTDQGVQRGVPSAVARHRRRP